MVSPDEAAVLFANDAFYNAFALGDADAMVALWSASAPITCIHPGGGMLAGRADVLDSWRAILDSHSTDGISCADAKAYVVGDMAWVTCFEVVGGGHLAATNVFVREGKAWKVVHHQAGPTAAEPESDAAPQGPVQ